MKKAIVILALLFVSVVHAQNYTTTLLVNKTPQEVFNAVTNTRAWWSEEIDGNTATLNEEFVYHYKDVHYCKVKLIEVIPGKKVVWEVLKNHFSFTKDKAEWTGTRMSFEIAKKGKQTELVFTHIGLVPDYECFNICREGWANYIDGSLKNLITTGKGQPNPKEGKGFNAQIVEKWDLN